MSAICGLYAKKDKFDPLQAFSFREHYDAYPFDYSNYWHNNSVFLSAHLNFITPESYQDKLPLADSKNYIVISADAIIDNRKELFDLLDIRSSFQEITDSELILMAYREWGVSCSERLLGDFVFAIWDMKKKELFCSRDQVGKRCLYYYNSGEIFAFSSLIGPLFNIREIKKGPDEVFIADFLYNSHSLHNTDPARTIYKDIMQLPAGHSLIISRDKFNIWQYWSSFDNAIENPENGSEEFIDIFKRAIECRSRSKGKIGLMLSGGLDSGSIAVILGKEKTIHAYTKVPVKDYENYLPETQIADETLFVKELCRHFPNIKENYMNAEGKDPLTAIDPMLDILELPFKAFQNSHWLCEIAQQAKQDGIKVLLDGQIGNATISWGKYDVYLDYLFSKRRFIDLYKELKTYSKNRYNRLFLGMFYKNFPDHIKKIADKIRGKNVDTKSETIINPDFYKRSGYDFSQKENFYDDRIRLLGLNTLGYLGVLETKMSIFYGLAKRDPTRDRRIIEFCMRTPVEDFVGNGVDRKLLRSSMKGLLPDRIRLNTKLGRQSADWLQRVSKKWHNTRMEIDQIGEHELEKKYLDIDKIKLMSLRNRSLNIKETNNLDMVFLMRALIFSRFIRKNF